VNGLRLVAAAPTPALRQALFGGDQNLDEGGRNAAAALAPRFARVPAWVAAPSRAARQTAAALGGLAATADALADPPYGEWDGRSLADIDPGDLHEWLSDPGYAPPGGESLTHVRDRAGAWLDEQAGQTLVAVAHPTVVRAAVAHALRLPADGIWTIEVAPLATVHLTHRSGRWHLSLS
jgi:broad specificity phosphatase PhoE